MSICSGKCQLKDAIAGKRRSIRMLEYAFECEIFSCEYTVQINSLHRR